MWRLHDSRSSFRFGFCIGSTDVSSGFAEFFQFLLQARVGDGNLRGERLRPAEFEELGSVNGSRRVEEEANYLHDIAGVVFEERATNVAEFLGGRAPFGASVQEHFDALEGLSFFVRFSIGAPRRPVLRPAGQAVKR
jgi:hypothetical protein